MTPHFGTSLGTLEVLRFFTGLGLGAAIPGTVSIASEYAPAKSRATIVGLMWCGFPLGAVFGGVLAAWLIPSYGWASLFYVGGAAPLLILVVLLFKLPESARFLQVRGDAAAAARIYARLGLSPDTTGTQDPSEAERSPVADLFRQGRAVATVLLWAAMFLTLLMAYFLTTWLPTIAAEAGVRSALLAVATLNLGGVIGCVLIGRLADRYDPAMVIGAAYGLGACAITLIGAGRLGGIIGPVLGGALIGAGLGVPILFLLAGVISLCTAVVLFCLSVSRKRPAEAPVLASDERKAVAS